MRTHSCSTLAIVAQQGWLKLQEMAKVESWIKEMHRYKRFLALLLMILLLAQGCAKKAAVTAQAPIPSQGKTAALRGELEEIFSDANFENAFWGVMIQSLENGEIIYQKNHKKFLMPASNMKIPTAAAALVKLGPDYVFQTKVLTDGEIQGDTLKGNLIVIGSGDPTVSGRFANGDTTGIFKAWAEKLKSLGIAKIAGDVVGIDDVFDNERLGAGWTWDDLPYGYAAEISGLAFNENHVDLKISPGDRVGDTAKIVKDPDSAYAQVVNHLVTVAKDSELSIKLRREPRTNTIVVSGTFPINESEQLRTASVDNPTAYFVYVLREVLERSGIKVTGTSLRTADKGFERNPEALRLLFAHNSPKLSEIITVLLKVSQNLYAETLMKTLGREIKNEGSFAAGRKAIEEVMTDFGIPPRTYTIADGSGLSRYNYLTADTIMHILRKMYWHAQFKPFYDALPVAGVDGTIKNRMKGTRTEGNVHAKTGTLANVRSLSGYVTTKDGEMLAFVMIANNFNVPNEAAEYVQDLALERLANFSRK
jgi:D-alanyl-D-alanine carboxypeptidase/D-alanyl-D-alanine-endopeptidase (penicillin-binding protein 4)